MIKLISIRCIKCPTAPFFSNFNIGKHHCAMLRGTFTLKIQMTKYKNEPNQTITLFLDQNQTFF